MHDVAREAGVSLKTVSRVVNREGGVSEALTARVESAVAAMGYRPDDRARRLRRAAPHAATIGFVLVDVANPFFSSLLRGIEDVARSRGCLVLAGSTDRSEVRERRLIEELVDRRVDGLIVAPSGTDVALLTAEIHRGSPVVLLDRELPGDVPLDVVRSDHYGGALAATRHLLDRGHTEVAYLGDDLQIFTARLRLAGFRDAMDAAGLRVPDDRVISGSYPADEWRTITSGLFEAEPHPTALFTAQNYVTIGSVNALHDLGLQHRIALVGFDDFELAETLDPAITVVPQQPREMGRRAAELLFRRIDGTDEPPIRDIIDHPLVARGSGEIPPP